MRTSRLHLFITATLALTACGEPCLPHVVGDTAIIVAEACDAAVAEDSDSHSGETGDLCTMQPAEGEAWGPCDPAGSCSVDNFCHTDVAGSICLPACGMDGCPATVCDDGGQCLNDGECAPLCRTDADCPIDGMQCSTIQALTLCNWPA